METRDGFFRPFKLERFFARWEFEAKWLLCSSDCESMSVADIVAMEEGGARELLDLRLGYTETRGSPDLRNAIAKRYFLTKADGVIVHSGAEEAILNLCLALLSRGDRVVVNDPCYQSLAEIPRSLGCEVIPWKVRQITAGEKKRWYFDPDELNGLLSGGAKLVILNAPHNPTGALPTHAELSAIVDACREAGAILFMDEVYRNLEHNPARRLPCAADAYENGVSLDVMSKSPGLAGLRIGWLATRRQDILDGVARVKDYNSICASGPSEVIASIALRHMDVIIARNRGIVERNLASLRDFFSRRPDIATWIEPEGGSIAFPSLSGGLDAEEVAARLVTETGVLILPGAFYDCDKAHFRIGYGRANMKEALGLFEAWFDGKSSGH